MTEYRVKRESNGDYTVTPVTQSGCATAFFVILILLVIVLIASRCSRPNGKEMKEQEQAQIAAEEAFQQQKEINLADQRGELDYTVEEEAVDCTGRTHHHVIEIAAQARPADYETELYHIPEGFNTCSGTLYASEKPNYEWFDEEYMDGLETCIEFRDQDDNILYTTGKVNFRNNPGSVSFSFNITGVTKLYATFKTTNSVREDYGYMYVLLDPFVIER